MKKFYLLLITGGVALGGGLFIDKVTVASAASKSSFEIAKAKDKATTEIHTAPLLKNRNSVKNIHAGHYLSSKFAQNNHDWATANQFIHQLINADIASTAILQRAMILAMGSGHADTAIEIAHSIKTQTPEKLTTLAEIFILVDAMKRKNYQDAEILLKEIPEDGTMRFIRPFINGWLHAAQNTMDIKGLKQSTMQLYHAILISDYLDNHSDIERMIDKALKVEDITLHERGRIADLYGHVGLKNKALKLYQSILKENPKDSRVALQLSQLEQGRNEPLFQKISSAHHGMAKAFHDIAAILDNDNNKESARVFAHIALYLEPTMAKTKLLLAAMNANHKQYETALSLYKSIPSSAKEYMQAQHEIVDIYENTERFDDALILLQNLPNADDDVDTLIKIGNLYRNQEKFNLAVKFYNLAAKTFGDSIPENYWHLHYVRGIAYEQAGDWDNAEIELTTALALQPDHPYILNYLGYAWADKGIHLQKSLKMIKQAVSLRPTDGYITDSLGWVMYRTKNYENAVPVLERAVELLPYDPTINDHLGDAYWKVGRSLEAKFQWKRARNHSDDNKQIEKIEKKLTSGIRN